MASDARESRSESTVVAGEAGSGVTTAGTISESGEERHTQEHESGAELNDKTACEQRGKTKGPEYVI